MEQVFLNHLCRQVNGNISNVGPIPSKHVSIYTHGKINKSNTLSAVSVNVTSVNMFYRTIPNISEE